MRLMIQCQEIIFEGFPGTPLFLPDISQKLVYLSLPFLMDQKAADLLWYGPLPVLWDSRISAMHR